MIIKLEQNLELERCPHCKIDNPNLNNVHEFATENHDHTWQRKWKTYVCRRCGGAILAWASINSLIVKEIFPEGSKVFSTLPEKARGYLNQATNSIHAPAGAVMLAASSVDAMLKNKDYVEGNLYDRINKAADDHLITQDMAQWAHQVRLEANNQRHSDENASLPTAEDAKKVLDFANALAEFLFELPARIESGLENTVTDNSA
ncbi:MAG: DUF4145 domain-containing protein [Patescibacteria group bacterium]